MKNYLTDGRGIASERVKIVEGGMREQFQAEVWLVAENGELPEINPAIDVDAGTGKPQELFD